MRAAVQGVLDDVLSPLLERDDSAIELVALDDEVVVVRVTGRAAFGAGAEYVQRGVIEPALRKIVGERCAVRIEKAVPTPRRRA